MSNALSKSERRKEQNRRAQAKLRKKQQRRIEDLEQQIQWLKTQAHVATTGELMFEVDEQFSVDAVHAQSPIDFGAVLADPTSLDLTQMPTSESNRESFTCKSSHVPSYSFATLEQNDIQAVTNPATGTPHSLQLISPPDPSPVASTNSSTAPTFHHATSNNPQQESLLQCPEAYCAFDALAKNASLLGITPESFLSTHSNSPFFSPLQSTKSIATSISHLPRDFHPTMAQLSYPHQPWIDCIPLRDLRSRIIFAESHKPPFLDVLDLWHDVLSDGLSCITDPQDASLWTMSDNFMNRWQMLLTLDLKTLEAMCLSTNPPVRIVSLPGL